MTVKYLDTENYYVKVQIDFATEYGVNEAFLTSKLSRLLEKLEGKTDDSGDKWIRLTLEEWHQELPFLGKMTIRRTLESCTNPIPDGPKKREEIFLTRTFKGRSKWYRLNPEFVEQPKPDVTVQIEHIPQKK